MKIRLFTIPNLLTLASLLCGSFAVVSALVYGDLALAFWLTIAAGVFDYSDGFVARLLKCPSAIGVQLDSLSDMVSFGVAPAAIAYGCGAQGLYDRIVLVFFVACGVSRLAPKPAQRPGLGR